MITMNEVMIEITRVCNMACSHCIRGKSQKEVIDKETLRSFFRNLSIESIGRLNFTGGEPSLYPEVIIDTLEIMREMSVKFDSFFIATNGTQHSKTDDFLLATMKLHAAAESPEDCLMKVSRDDYHLEAGLEHADDLYRTLVYCTIEDSRSDYALFNDGLAFENGNSLAVKHYDVENVNIEVSENLGDVNIYSDEPIYLSSTGKIGIGCNFSYDTFDAELAFCHVDEIEEQYEFISKLSAFAEENGLTGANFELENNVA